MAVYSYAVISANVQETRDGSTTDMVQTWLIPMGMTTFNRVLDRMIYVTVTEIVPGMDEGKLRAEISAMVAG